MSYDNEALNVKLYDSIKQEARILELEDYVVGAVAAAMPPEFPQEALKAQAICCRTMAVKRMGVFGKSGCKRQPGFDLCTDPSHCQGFIDDSQCQRLWGSQYEEYIQKIRRAVNETAETILVYNDNAINAVYHPACGGFTEDSENVWGNKVSYLRRVECIYCKDSPYWKSEENFSIKELKRKLAINFDDDHSDKREIPGFLDNIVSTPSGRVKKITIGDMVFDGDQVRSLLGLPSTRFFWKVSSLSLAAMGKGNGLGLCQYGARGMALLGFPVDEILKFYFTGVELKRIEKPTSAKPLAGKTIVLDPGNGGDGGSSGPMGLSEGYVNLEIAKAVAFEAKKCGASVFLTRDKNEFVSLSERVRISNQKKPDITISIHQNIFSDEKVGGTETFYYLGDVEGKKISEYIHRELISSLKTSDLGVKEADLYMLRETNNSCVLINVAFLSNPEEERMLSEPGFRQKAAAAIVTGIECYYQE